MTYPNDKHNKNSQDRDKEKLAHVSQNADHILNKTDTKLLNLLHQANYLTTKQIGRAIFGDKVTPSTATRRANRATLNLKRIGYLKHLDRRVGGVRAGSSSYVWCLSNNGSDALSQLNQSIKITKRRSYEPTENHLEHTLAIAELYIQLIEINREDPSFEIEDTEFEPKCWRSYSDIGGTPIFLKPDLFAKVIDQEYENYYFFELDRSSTSLTRVVNKAKQYIRYYNLGIEQRVNGVFPFVVWVVPDDKRKYSVAHRINSELDNYTELFVVITLDEFKGFVGSNTELFNANARQDNDR